MHKKISAVLIVGLCAGWHGQALAEISLPSGQLVVLQEMRLDDAGESQGTTARFRYIAPDIDRDAGRLRYIDVQPDFEVLCSQHALITLQNRGITASQIVVSLSDRPTEFGEAAPEATQYFEAFRIENETCILEAF
ncbi:DUF6497 family protein [Pseudaestuariivita rosea]|uniref:DUF6497 family protein n=1 Tax=Pseudaestuariivita rosea TaxID=2763263 RepID=UPI001ABB1CC0|nr:DUF6497 family protein [Pseudaestuariivita rosea]